jgi:hypothetical protein
MIIETIEGEAIKLHTGDEILCAGTGHLSKLIQWYNRLMGAKGEAAEISHVAKFICGEVFEATTLNKWCLKSGYQSNPFDEWLQNYTGSVWVRQLSGADIDEEKYFKAAYGLLGTPYEHGIPGLLELLLTSVATKIPFLKKWARKHLETKELHCSEANVKLSQLGGYYDRTARANKLPPCTFWTGGQYEKGFTAGFLGLPKRIK